MAAGFSIRITAVDSATKRIDAINKHLAAARAPVDRLGKSLQTLGRLSGVSQVATSFQRMGRGALDAFRSIARIVAPLSAIAGAASVGGMYRMVEAWSQWGSQINFVSQRIGLSAQQLQKFQGAGLLAGTSVAGMTSGLQALGQSMYEALGGRNPEFLAMMNQLGISIDDGTRHTRSLNDVLPQLADKIASIHDPFTQARIATAAFGGAADDMLPFLRRGSKGIAELQKLTESYGVTTKEGIKAADDLRYAQANLSLATQGLGNSISQALAPVLTPLMLQLADWIRLHRTLISGWIGDHVRQLAIDLQQIDFGAILTGLGSMAHSADVIAKAFGGWKVVIEGLIALKFGSWLLGAVGGVNLLTAALASLTLAYAVNSVAYDDWNDRKNKQDAITSEREYQQRRRAALKPGRREKFDEMQARHGGTISSGVTPLDQQRRAAHLPTSIGGNNQAAAMSYFKSQGWSSAQASGIVANLMAESGLKPGERGDGGSAAGIGQWHPDRQANFAALFGHDIAHGSFNEQLAFTQWELQNTERRAGDKLRGAGTAAEAGSIVSRFYERPAAVDEAAHNRADLATRVQTADGAAGANGKVDVHIQLSGGGVDKTTARAHGNVNAPKVATTGVGSLGAT